MTNSPYGRLAFRTKGTLWVAYYALPGTMKGALFLGSIVMAGVVDHPARKQLFMGLLAQDIVADILREQTGGDVHWLAAQRAPETERGGRA